MNKAYEAIDRFENGKLLGIIDKIMHWVIFITGAAVSICLFAQVLMRYVFKSDLFGIEEVIMTVTFWFYFFGATNGSRENSHIKADLMALFVKNEKVLWIQRIIIGVVEVGVIIFLAILSFWLLKINLQIMPSSTALDIPQIVPQAAMDIAWILMGIYSLLRLIKAIFSYPSEGKAIKEAN